MKHVFIETNFLVAVARPLPEAAAERLLDRHGSDVTLYVPWCSVGEAQRTLERIIGEDLGFDEAMMKFAVHTLKPDGDTQTLSVIQKFASKARDAMKSAKTGLDAKLKGLIQRMKTIPPSDKVVEQTLQLWTVKKLPPFDEMVLGAVLAKAAELHAQGERELFFCNLNKNDFSPYDKQGKIITQPKLDAEYTSLGLTYLPSFNVPS